MVTTIVCIGGAITAGAFPSCSTGWQVAESLAGFDVNTLDPVAILSAFSAGAIVSFVPLSIAWACSFILSMLRG